MRSLKDRLIQETEGIIDNLRKERARLQEKLDEIEPQLEEARQMLVMLRTGAQPKRKNKPPLSEEKALEVLDSMASEFDTPTYARAADITGATAARWLSKFAEAKLITRTRVGRGDMPSLYVKES